MKQFFLTGTDTNVGKTVTAAVLTSAFNAHYWKPIQAGSDWDAERIKQWTGLGDSQLLPSAYIFKASLSPDQAAALENKSIDLDHCQLPRLSRNLIVEGAGGVCVPLNSHSLMLDLMKKLNIPIIIVSRGTLGTINHTLLTIEMLKQHRLSIEGIIFSGELNPANQAAIEKWGNVRTLLHIPTFKELTKDHVKKWITENQSIIEESFL